MTDINDEVPLNPAGSYSGGTHYILQGDSSAPLIVLLHGIGSHCGLFDDLAAHLVSSGFQVLRYDLMGRGYSSYPKDNYLDRESAFSGFGHVIQLRQLLIGLQLTSRQYHLLGHSMGGAIAALYADRFRDEVRSLILLTPAGLMDLGILAIIRKCSCLHGIVKNALRGGQENAWRKDFFEHTGASLVAEERMMQSMRAVYSANPRAFEAFWQSVLHFPLSSLHECVVHLASLTELSVMLLWAKQDGAVPLAPNYHRWVSMFSDSQHPDFVHKVYDQASHGFYLERPQEVHADISSFLATRSSVEPVSVKRK